ncbi:MAG: anaerobic ribonucleoside-triphosphate reductase activating protein [Planctomycetaceae bacterium]|nr:anaerobic ribonucleoside-triphosphate reductase activating protein [Planctomycetaceae bacterium]
MDEAIDFDLRGFIENSLLEWENNVAAVVVAGGCNLRCPFCHSWRYVTGLDDLHPLDLEAVFDLLDRQRGWIDGVVVTGGEPTLQPGLAPLLRRLREYGVKTKLHTNGTRPEVVEALLQEGLLDCLALDYKSPLDDRFYPASGLAGDNGQVEAVKKTFALAADSGIEREYHTTLVPAFISPEDIAQMAANLEKGGTWFLQQFENGDCLDATMAGARRYDDATLDTIEAAATLLYPRVIMKRGKSA